MNTFSPQSIDNVLLTIDSWESEMDDISLQDKLEYGLISSKGYRKCPKCKVWKSKATEYYLGESRFIRVRTYCKSCDYKRSRYYIQRNKDRYQKYARKSNAKRVGIFVEDYDIWYEEQLAKQDGKCAMSDCRLPVEKNLHGRLSVDHDHVTGKFRGLICNRCNSFLGHYEKRKLVVEAYLGG